ncbi:MAG: hypothetical protein KGQ62_02835 [Gammaproteobacteria bacterium]|nr:hypothetical protein [Gammaproteobacteria bacterium]MBU6509624.1 hypothetical protein [Gammaproteobacteria bacterium]MDE1983720.1 hypothetical protein [Gammaproteobacteria bacterium]MDE2108471.1 hypothetical protein [Gammaproteobacteria bacterium]
MADAANTASSFFARLKQHHIYRVAAWYGATIAVLIQVVARAFPYFGWSAAVPAVIIILIVGFPVAIVLAWLLVTPADSASQTGWQKRRWKLGTIVTPIVIAAVVVSGIFAFRFSEHRTEHLAATQEVAKATVPVSANTLTLSSATAVPAKSVAVLPFLNESRDKDQQYFSDGLSEDLITALSQFASLKVINRDSSFRFRNSQDSVQIIGAKLGVAHLLEGSVRQLGDEVRISAELVNVSDGSTLWSQHYDRPYKNLFALQDDITKSVAGALQAKLLPVPGAATQGDRPPSGSLAAYNAYLQGKFYSQRGTEVDVQKAIGYFTNAIRIDPRYALAWVALGRANFGLAASFVGGSEAASAWDRARAALQTALALDPNLATAHGFYAAILASHDHAWLRAEAEAQLAYQLAPDREFAALAEIRAALGHSQQAVELLQQGLPNDPLCAVCYDHLARYLSALGRFDEAMQAARKSVQLAPERYSQRVTLVKIEIMRGAAAAALQAAQQSPPGVSRDAAMAFALQISNDRAAADAALQTLLAGQAGFNPYFIAEIYALRRDPDNMFKWLEHSNETHDPGLRLLLTDPWILRYRNDPRFAAFCKQVGLPTATDAKALP